MKKLTKMLSLSLTLAMLIGSGPGNTCLSSGRNRYHYRLDQFPRRYGI